jgi:hypothetical protein
LNPNWQERGFKCKFSANVFNLVNPAYPDEDDAALFRCASYIVIPNAVSTCKREFLVGALCITSCYPAGIEFFSKKRSGTLGT